MDNKIWDIKEKEKICCFDIDGVLMDCYPKCWIEYVNEQLNIDFEDLNEMKKGISYETYRNLKEHYRLSGIKETFPANIEASTITKILKEKGYKIIIMTARPAYKYPTLYAQTVNWLNKNNIIYDSIIFEEKNKHAKIMSEFHNIKFMVEDNSYVANQISKWGYKVFLLKNEYNNKLLVEKNVIRINKLSEILNDIE